MFSLQTIFGKGDKFYGLLEASAAAARESARALVELLAAPPQLRSLEKFKLARQREKNLQAQISQELVNTFVTALEREDIDALSTTLYKIPKIVEKFAERYMVVTDGNFRPVWCAQAQFNPRVSTIDVHFGIGRIEKHIVVRKKPGVSVIPTTKFGVTGLYVAEVGLRQFYG